jgi:hypothetical protein
MNSGIGAGSAPATGSRRLYLGCDFTRFGQVRCIFLNRPVAIPNSAVAAGDLFHAPACFRGKIFFFKDVRIAFGARSFVLGLDQQPIIAFFARPPMHPHQMPFSMKLLALEAKIEMSFRQPLVRISERLPGPAIPNHHCAAAVLSLWNRAFEFVVFDRMIFDLHRQPLFARHQAWPARNRPALHHAIELKAKVIMQPRGRVLLNDESMSLGARRLAARFGSHVKAPLGTVGLQAHFVTVDRGGCFQGRKCNVSLPERFLRSTGVRLGGTNLPSASFIREAVLSVT